MKDGNRFLLKYRTAHSLLLEWVVLFLCFGYPLQVMVVILLKTESTPVNMGFRAAYLFISLYLIVIGLLSRPKKLPIALYFLLLFWIIYGARLIYDIEFRGITFLDKSGFYLYGYAFGSGLIPALAVLLNASFLNVKRFMNNLFLILLVANVCIAVPLWVYNPDGFLGILTKRSELIIMINMIPVNLINAITISFFGGLLSLATLWLLLEKRKPASWKWEILLWGTLIVGIFNLLAGASKGPFFSCVLIGIYLAIVWARSRRKTPGFRKIWYSVSIIIILVLAAVGILFWQFESISKIQIIPRLVDFIHGEDGGSNIRVLFWKSAWNQFLAHPLVGDRFLTGYLNNYPHNLILESLLATGIIGAFLFFSFVSTPFYLFYKLGPDLKMKFMVIWIAFLSIFMLAMVSGALFNSSSFWIISALVIGVFYNEKSKMKQNELTPENNHE